MDQFFDWLKTVLEGFYTHLPSPIGTGRPRSSRWPTVRGTHLRRFPNCAACGRTTALEVHHIIPFQADPELELSPDNLITLCADPCHLMFGHLGNWQSWNVSVRADAASWLNKIRNRP